MSDGRPRLARKLDARLGVERASIVRTIGHSAHERGEHAFLVGGVVRDLLLGRRLQDVDVAIEGEALELARRLSEDLGVPLRTHRRFETATIRFSGPWHLDFARTRSERYDRPAMLPRVTPASLDEDLRRRDFTVNSLAIDLSPSGYGRLIDPLDGRRDLAGRTIRALHEDSFLDDPTRAFRAVRFAARLGFRIGGETMRQIRAARHAGVFEALTAARVRAEVSKLFEESGWDRIGALLFRAELWATIDPRLGRTAPRALSRVERSLRSDDPLLLAGGAEDWSLALAWVSAGFSAAARERLIARLRPTRRSARTLREAGRGAQRVVAALGRLADPTPSRVYRVCSSCSPETLVLARAVAPEGVRRLLDRYVEQWRGIRADVDGEDLLAAGIRPGPGVARGLAAALRAKLDGRGEGREAQLRIALRAARRA